MDFGEIVLLLASAFAAVVGLGTAVLMAVGFSPARGAAITVTFLCLGFWNPLGWIVLGLCVYLQVKENRERLEQRSDAQMRAFAENRRSGGPVFGSADRMRRGELCEGSKR